MADRLKEMPKKFLEWWNAFTPKQKTIIICAVAGVALGFAILITALTRPQYELLANCETTKEASEITNLLEGEGIAHVVSEDGLTIRVLKENLSDANLLLGANNITAASYDISHVTDGGFSTTEADKQKKYVLYLEGKMEEDLARLANVKSAFVQFSIPEDDGTLIANDEESYASVILELDGEFTTDNANAAARTIATALGNDSTNNIVILDTDGNLLFSGADDLSLTGNASSQLTVKQQAEALVTSEVKKVLVGTNEFDRVEVGSNLSLDFSTTEVTDHSYTPADGQTQGVLSSENIYQSDSTGGVAGVPGTDSNTETTGPTYVFENGESSSQSVTEESRKYLPNESITSQSIPPGLIQYNQSSVSVSAIKYNVLREEDARTQGLLDGVSWAEYQIANSERVKVEVDEDLVDLVSKATGIATENITIVAYEEPLFIDRDGSDISTTDIVQIVLIVVILGLLGFVVLRSMRADKTAQEEAEEEISVEDLLQSAPTETVEDIELETKSETRILIEKFVEENPEAVANLLRNWLNEDWG